MQAADQEGLLVPGDESGVRVKIGGPAILQTAGNGGPEHQGSFTNETFNLFRGKGMVIIRSTGEPGSITVEVSSKGLKPASITLEAN